MRLALFAAALVAWPVTAWADPADPADPDAQSASAAFGVGAFGERPSMSVDLGVDIEHGNLAVGVGGRVRWLAGEGLRDEDWDDPSEYGTLVRYLSYRRAPTGDVPGVAFAAGPLGDVHLGHGTLVAGYTSGLDADRRRLGAQAAAAGTAYELGAMIDDVVAPRIVASRFAYAYDAATTIGLSVAGDLDAPLDDTHRMVPIAGLDVAYAWRPATVYADAIAILDSGAGVHVGSTAHTTLAGARLEGRLEVRAGTDRYVPGYFGPLYEIERATRLATTRAGGLFGAGGLAGTRLDIPDVGSLSASYATRPGLPDELAVRFAAPHYRRIQLGLWAATQVRGGAERALAAELRGQLPQGFFAVADAARLYRAREDGLEPVWTATVAVGRTLDW